MGHSGAVQIVKTVEAMEATELCDVILGICEDTQAWERGQV